MGVNCAQSWTANNLVLPELESIVVPASFRGGIRVDRRHKRERRRQESSMSLIAVTQDWARFDAVRNFYLKEDSGFYPRNRVS